MIGCDILQEVENWMRSNKITRYNGYHVIAAIDRMLEVDMGLSWATFEKPAGAVIRPLRASEVRLRGQTGEWYVHDEADDSVVPELPTHLHPLPFLHFANDKCGDQWAAMHFAADFMQVMIRFSDDRYHDDWNVVLNALKQSGEDVWSNACQLTVLYSTTRAPFDSNTFLMAIRGCRDHMAKMEPQDCDAFMDELRGICDDFGVDVPRTDDGRRVVFERFLSVPCITNVGALAKPSKWFSLFRAMATKDPYWHAMKALTKHYRQHVANLSIESLYDAARLAEEFQNVERPKQIIQIIKEKGENSLAVSLHFFSDINRECQRMLLTVVGPLWTRHSLRAKSKLSPLDNKAWRTVDVNYWRDEIATTVWDALLNPATLAYMFVEVPTCGRNELVVTEEQLAKQKSIVVRIFDFLQRLLNLRVWSHLIHAELPPDSFASLMEETGRNQRLQDFAKEWRVSQLVEHRASQNKSWSRFVANLYWFRWPAVRVPFML